jgi:hypothetical protein
VAAVGPIGGEGMTAGNEEEGGG